MDLAWSHYTKQRSFGDNDKTLLPLVGMLAKSCPKLTFIEKWTEPKYGCLARNSIVFDAEGSLSVEMAADFRRNQTF